MGVYFMLIPIYNGPDALKFIFVILINPLLSEISGVTSRVTCRASRHNHQTTSWLLISVAVLYKKLFARFIIGSVAESYWLITSSCVLAVVELTARTTMPMRDAFMYRRVFGAYLDADLNAVALMTNVRSRGLRAETEMIESITDLVFLIQVTIFPFLYLVSTNGKGLPTVEKSIERVCIQLAVEIVMDFLVTTYLAVIQNYHLMTNSLTKCRRYGLVLGTMVLLLIGWLNTATLNQILCVQNPTSGDADWVVCGKARHDIYGS